MSVSVGGNVLVRGQILHCIAEPRVAGEDAWQYWADGILWVEQGKVKAVGAADVLLAQLPPDASVAHYPDYLIVPGFIDCHIHYPQTEMIAAYGEQLLDWLQKYIFPTERQFADATYASRIASFFLQELVRNGTTTALVFGTVHPTSVEAFFKAAQALGLRMIAGKVMMDRHAPDYLCDTPETSYHDSKALIERWHGVERLQYAVTPRFAPTSTREQLTEAARLLQEYPDVYLHTHVSENLAEIAWVRELFPEALDYTDVYAQAGLLRRRSVLAHGVHLSERECACIAEHATSIAHCPTSNQFLGSGLLPLERLQQHGIRLGLGTDVGGGTSFSLLQTMNSAYQIQQLRGNKLDPMQAFYYATLGGAEALDLTEQIGNFAVGKEADFILLDPKATPLLKLRQGYCRDISEQVFVLNTLGDDRCVAATYALGQCVYRRE